MSDPVVELQKKFSLVLAPLGWVYGGVMRVREVLYLRGLIASWESGVPTVSVGNIGWGGTGKTPLSGWLLDWAVKHKLDPVLLTRGYRAKPVSYPYYVSPGALPEEAGDEPLMLAKENPDAHIVVDPVRTRGGRVALKQFNPKLIVLDDGFQHMAMRRHLDLVLLRPEDLAEDWNKVIPAGSWRESEKALGRADAFLIKCGPEYFRKLKPLFRQRLDRFHKPIFSFQVLPTGIRRVVGDEEGHDFGGEPYILVTGVGNPRLVEETANMHFGYRPIKHMAYEDHHAYNKTDVMDMLAAMKRRGCKHIICTPKDAVKLGPMCTDDFWQFDLRVAFGPSSIGSQTTFDSWFTRRYDALSLQRTGQRTGRKMTTKKGRDDG